MSDFHSDPRHSKARKDKLCIWCGEDIAKGDKQVAQSGRFDGLMYHNCYHPECWAAASADPYTLMDGFTPYDNPRPKQQGEPEGEVSGG